MASPIVFPMMYCLGCGYCLHGLTEHRCPECGRPFVPGDPRTYSDTDKPHRKLGIVPAIVCTIATVICVLVTWDHGFTLLYWYDSGVLRQAWNWRFQVSGHVFMFFLAGGAAVVSCISAAFAWRTPTFRYARIVAIIGLTWWVTWCVFIYTGVLGLFLPSD